MLIDSLDKAGFAAINSFVGTSVIFDRLIVFAANAPFVKLGVLIFLLIMAWFVRPDVRVRARILAGIAGLFAALAIARLMQGMLPVRLRPMHAIENASIADGLGLETLSGWSSFPSDHAALAFGLVTIIWLADRRYGVAAFLWALLVVCLPRVYLGFHYPGDIVAGALIGVICVILAGKISGRQLEAIAASADRTPHYFYPIAFSVLFMIGTLFNDIRDFGSMVKGLVIEETITQDQPNQPI